MLLKIIIRFYIFTNFKKISNLEYMSDFHRGFQLIGWIA